MLEEQYAYINELVENAKAGDSEAFKQLATYYRPLILASVKRCIHREPRLINYKEDIENEIYLIFNELVKLYDPNLSYFSYYLLTRLDYWILSRSRRFLNKTASGSGLDVVSFSDMPHDWEPEYVDDPLGRIANKQVLQDALSQLNSKQREAIDLYYYQGLNQEEASAALEITQASFSKRLNRALENLRKILPEDFYL